MYSVRGMLVLAIRSDALGFALKFARSLFKTAAQFPSDDVRKVLKKYFEGTEIRIVLALDCHCSLLSYSAKDCKDSCWRHFAQW